jgi:hypothetical protein
MKSKFLNFALMLASVSAVDAATIAVGRGIGNPGITAQVNGGESLSAGGFYIAVGTFTNASGATEVPAITTEFSSLLAAVAQFDVFSSVTSSTTGATIGTITGSFAATGGADPSQFNLKPIYFLVGNGETKESSTAFGIFSVAAGAAFPANVAATVSNSVTLSSGASITPLLNAGTVNGNVFSLVPIPEPSTALLGAIGALGLLRRRRN